MKEDFIKYVGQRIESYRLEARLSVDALAQKANRSRKTIYNYEKGVTAMDVSTLADISKALGIALPQLLDFVWRSQPAARLYPFGQYEAIDSLYMYHIQDGAVHTSFIRATAPGANGISAIMYYKVARIENPDNCSCIYTGHTYSEYSTLSFIMRNYFNKAENILINMTIRNPGNSYAVGLASGLDAQTLEPIAFKVLVSVTQFEEGEARRRLEISPEEYRRVRTTGALRIQDP